MTRVCHPVEDYTRGALPPRSIATLRRLRAARRWLPADRLGRQTGKGREPVDAAIAWHLREQDAESAAVLAATGDAGARRLVSLAFGEESEPFDNPIPDVDGRDAIDRWSAALSVVAVAAPLAFMEDRRRGQA